MHLNKLHTMNGKACSCGKTHSFSSKIIAGSGCIGRIPTIMNEMGCDRPFLLADTNTWNAAGNAVSNLLTEYKIPYSNYVYSDENLEPDEKNVGSAFLHFDTNCDVILAVGSGVINDIGKILSNVSGKPYIIVATAPSMDGYASATSSMTRDGLKVSIPSRCADVIIGDTDILCLAPMELLKAGLGDMLAKYISLCEWRISHLINGEYYCEEIAQLVRESVKACVDNAPGLLQRDPQAVSAVFDGLIITGVAMNYAGNSRPASGAEHYISHILDMRGISFGTPVSLHGIQCALGTYICADLYEQIKGICPNRDKALSYVHDFNFVQWSQVLREFIGKGAETMIVQEEKEHKYDPASHAARLDRILAHWDKIVTIIEEEIPSLAIMKHLYRSIGLPCALSDLGIEDRILPTVFKTTKDIRDKYVLSRLAWDIGILEEII